MDKAKRKDNVIWEIETWRAKREYEGKETRQNKYTGR